MKSLAFSCLICPLNPYFNQKVLRKGKNTRGCPKLKKLLKSCRAQPGQAQGRGGGGGRGEMVGRRVQIYESAFFFFLDVRWFMMLQLSQIFFPRQRGGFGNTIIRETLTIIGRIGNKYFFLRIIKIIKAFIYA